MKKILVLFVAVLVFVGCFAVTTFADYDGKSVYDMADLFTDEEEARIESVANKCFAKSYASVYIVTHGSTSGDVDYWGDHFREEYKIERNCIILIITANSRNNYDLYTYGKCASKVTNSEVDKILDANAVYSNIKGGNYADGAVAFIELSAPACKTNVGGVFAFSVIISLIISLIVFFSVKGSYNKKMRSDKYPLDRYAKLSLRLQRDDFIGSYVSKRYISSSSGSGGSHHSGGGGGGGHRGGR